MSGLDIAITALYFGVMLVIGVVHARRASGSMRSYYLGDNRSSWWMLAASGAASNFDVSGTMFLVSLFYIVGFHAFWMLWSWGFFNAAFLMAYMAVWIRRTGVMTAVELMSVRFGDERGGRMARTAGAILMVTFLVFSIGYAYAGLSKFLPVMLPGIGPGGGQLIALGVMAVTTLYVTLGGFSSVVVADVIQLVMSSSAGLAVGVIVFLKLDPHLVTVLHAKLSTDLMPHMRMTFPAGYESWDSFGYLCIYWVLSGLMLNMSGAGGHYGEQRFLATRSDVDAAKAGAAWGLFLLPRWAMTVGFVFIAATGLVGASDPEQILPIVIVKMVPAGLRGLIIAALFAAFMSSFSSTVNAAASMVVRDLIEPARPDLSAKTLIRLSYGVTVLLVAVGVGIGLHAESIKSIWVWMIAGVIGATLIPNVLRWHWWRFNGWGYAWGVFAGLGTTAMFGGGQALGWFGVAGLAEYQYAPVIWASTLLGAVAGSLLTAPTPDDTLRIFYERVRPFGAWGPIRALSSPAVLPARGLIALNVILGIAILLCCNMSVFFVIGHYSALAAATLSAAAVCAVVLYFTWYKRLPHEPATR